MSEIGQNLDKSEQVWTILDNVKKLFPQVKISQPLRYCHLFRGQSSGQFGGPFSGQFGGQLGGQLFENLKDNSGDNLRLIQGQLRWLLFYNFIDIFRDNFQDLNAFKINSPKCCLLYFFLLRMMLP